MPQTNDENVSNQRWRFGRRRPGLIPNTAQPKPSFDDLLRQVFTVETHAGALKTPRLGAAMMGRIAATRPPAKAGKDLLRMPFKERAGLLWKQATDTAGHRRPVDKNQLVAIGKKLDRHFVLEENLPKSRLRAVRLSNSKNSKRSGLQVKTFENMARSSWARRLFVRTLSEAKAFISKKSRRKAT
ncbi:MAG TPA: hypothetical protein VKW06_08810 [Candidatus Angelobacter sp.]|nr:hypothetical protein [Candidatus Angelobacter sp.]